MNNELDQRRARRIAHVKSHLDGGFNLDLLVRNVENGFPNARVSLMALSAHAQAKGIYGWFEERDLTSMRQWFHVAAKLDQKWYQMEEDKQGPGSKMLQLIKPLMSNDRSLIEWFAHYDDAYYLDRVEKQSTHDFWAYQAVVALRGEWQHLAERCERVVREPPGAASEQKYRPDHEFYLALARRDVGTMTEVLHRLVMRKMVNARRNDDSGYAADLISTAPVIYAKIAWFHGYEVRVDSPYIPSEWLPMEPQQLYDDRYGFL